MGGCGCCVVLSVFCFGCLLFVFCCCFLFFSFPFSCDFVVCFVVLMSLCTNCRFFVVVCCLFCLVSLSSFLYFSNVHLPLTRFDCPEVTLFG